MAWPDSLSSDLPPPRGDEPANLRQDIADELADHLTTAAAEERARGAAEDAARQAALDRFGDPTAVARQLWLEAMKGPIMRQRTLMAAAALLVLGVFAANGLAWMAFQQLRESNAALVAQLAAKKAEPGSHADLTVKLVQDNEVQSPAAGYQVDLVGQAVAGLESQRPGSGYGGYPRNMLLHEVANSEGIVRYPSIAPGIYELRVTTPWGWTLRRDLSLLARDWTETIACPANAPAEALVKVDFEWPTELQEKQLAVRLQFNRLQHSVPPDEWTVHPSVFSMIRDQRGNEPREMSRLASDSLLLSDFRPPTGMQEVWPGLYRLSYVQIIERGAEIDGESNTFEYVDRVRLGEAELKQPQFIAKPGDNTWSIALSDQGLAEVRTAFGIGEDAQVKEE